MKIRINRIILAAAVFGLASCQKEYQESSILPGSDQLVNAVLTATLDGTKVSYTETEEQNLHPSWENGDKILAFDDSKTNYVLTVTDVTDGVATLEGSVPANCNLHLIYTDGTDNALKDLKDGAINVNFEHQTGNLDDMPVIMLSDGEVLNGVGNFVFRNACSIVGVYSFKNIPADEAIKGIGFEGNNLYGRTIQLVNGKLEMTGDSGNGTHNLNINFTTPVQINEDGTLPSPVFYVIPSGATLKAIRVMLTRQVQSGFNLFYSKSVNKTIAAGQYHYVKNYTLDSFGQESYGFGRQITAVQLWDDGPFWGTSNLGGAPVMGGPQTIGYYFSWGNTLAYYVNRKETGIEEIMHTGMQEPIWYYYYNCEIKDLDVKLVGGFSESNYQLTQGYSLTGNIPSTVDYDAATLFYGKGWKTPTSDQAKELIEKATSIEWSEADQGIYIYGPNGNSIFIPSAGYVENERLDYGVDPQYPSSISNILGCNFWTKSISSNKDCAECFNRYPIFGWNAEITSRPRYVGMPIRPIYDPTTIESTALTDYSGKKF